MTCPDICRATLVAWLVAGGRPLCAGLEGFAGPRIAFPWDAVARRPGG
jgi:hypothetical protein